MIELLNKEVVNKNNTNEKEIKRFDIWWCDYGDLHDEEIGKNYLLKKKRPCVIVSNNKNNKHSPTVITVPMRSNMNKMLPTHVVVGRESGMRHEGVATCEQFLTVNKSQLLNKIGELDESKHEWMERAMKLSVSGIFE